jgi:hypothetical protein
LRKVKVLFDFDVCLFVVVCKRLRLPLSVRILALLEDARSESNRDIVTIDLATVKKKSVEAHASQAKKTRLEQKATRVGVLCAVDRIELATLA